MKTVNLRHHCISLHDLTPESKRQVKLYYFEKWSTQGFPIGKANRIETISVTADQCHTGEYWSNFMLANFVGRTDPSKEKCMCEFQPL